MWDHFASSLSPEGGVRGEENESTDCDSALDLSFFVCSTFFP